MCTYLWAVLYVYKKAELVKNSSPILIGKSYCDFFFVLCKLKYTMLIIDINLSSILVVVALPVYVIIDEQQKKIFGVFNTISI